MDTHKAACDAMLASSLSDFHKNATRYRAPKTIVQIDVKRAKWTRVVSLELRALCFEANMAVSHAEMDIWPKGNGLMRTNN